MAERGIDIGSAEVPEPRSGGINHLLAIAIDQYRHCPPLYNCVQDARRLIEVLSTNYQFDQKHIYTLFDEQATEHAIIDSFKKMVRLIGPHDNLLILFSGHGEYEKEIDEGYWIPVDAPIGHTNEYIANSRIIKYIRAIKAHHTFLIIDSCFSGSLFANRSAPGLADSSRLDAIASRWLLTAGRNEVVSDGKPGDHSPFADNVIYFLENNTAPSLSVAALVDQVVQAVIHNARQTPRGEPLQDVGHRGGQFHFYRKGFLPSAQPKVQPAPQPEPHSFPDANNNQQNRKYLLAALTSLLTIILLGLFLYRPATDPITPEPTETLGTQQEQYDSLLNLASQLFQLSSTSEAYQLALSAFEQAIESGKQDGIDISEAIAGKQRCEEKLLSLENTGTLEVAPVENVSQLLVKAKRSFKNQNFSEARQALENVLKQEPDNKEARNYLQQCLEELDWQKAMRSDTETNYRRFLENYPGSGHQKEAQKAIAKQYRYTLYFTTNLKQSNLLTLNIGKGKPPFNITITYLATGETINKTATGSQLEVSLAQFNKPEGKHMVDIVITDYNFKAKGQKMPLMR